MDTSFTPPFCPNPTCLHHHHDRTSHPASPFFRRFGSFHTVRDGFVPRFRCSSCHATFSASTFSLDYYAKRTLDLPQIFRSITEGESLSAIARHLSCSSASIQNRLDRLGRACLALHSRLSSSLPLAENLVADGFESFERSQYFPSHLNILVGAQSQFLFGFTHATLRRKGRMSDTQKRTRATLERRFTPPRAALFSSFSLLMREIPSHWNRSLLPSLTLTTDEHPAYPRAIASVPQLSPTAASSAFHHHRIPSSAPRTLTNPLFPVNYYDRELRKDIAAFHRESTCFTRNVASGLLRSACYLAWHNYQRPHRIRRKGTAPPAACHAHVAGICREDIANAWKRLFKDRPFVSRDALPDWALVVWEKRCPTPLASHHDFLPKYVLSHQQQGSMN